MEIILVPRHRITWRHVNSHSGSKLQDVLSQIAHCLGLHNKINSL